MARKVIHTEQHPQEVKPENGQAVWICRCGLSKNQPFCDSSHKKTADEEEDKMYEYDADGNRKEIE